MRAINKIVIHHSVSPRDQTLEKSIASFDKNHSERLHTTKNKLGFHIGYHYVIAGDGRYKQTRSIEEVGFHASNLAINNSSIGICLTGNFDIEKPTDAQMYALKGIIEKYKAIYPALTVHGHNEYCTKTCPGKNFDFNLLKKTIMLFYEAMRTEKYGKTPEDQRKFKDPKAFLERMEKLTVEEQLKEMTYLIAIIAENSGNK